MYTFSTNKKVYYKETFELKNLSNNQKWSQAGTQEHLCEYDGEAATKAEVENSPTDQADVVFSPV